MKRILCLWLPQWPIQRFRVARPELDRQPLVLFTTAPRGKKIVAFCSPEALQRGLTSGMPLAEAKALVEPQRAAGLGPAGPVRHAAGPSPAAHTPRGHFEVYDPHADRAALRRLALTCQQFGPYAAI